ncbi:Heme O synthase, protoheme IX farnesyltransferase COX10-CtaB, partial [hydrothermal vent metagenome]
MESQVSPTEAELSRIVPAQTPMQTPIEVHIHDTTAAHASVEDAPAPETTPVTPSTVSSYIQTTKPGITKLVTITATVGLGMAVAQRWVAGEQLWTLGSFVLLAFGVILGTALSASGANALNQWAERERDARMHRTANRPLPTGALTPPGVLRAGVLLSLAGLALLWATCGLAAMTVSAACVLIYVLVYTPLKATTWTATFVGAIPGALPPLIGWSAAYREVGFQSLLDPGAIS